MLRRITKRAYATAATVLKPSLYGQPLHASHPHLVQRNELTPGIPADEYERRRRKLMQSLPDNSVVVSVAAPVKYMSGKIFYKFRQASDFWYLTGFEEPDSACIIEKSNESRKGYKMTVFCSGSTASTEKWDGARTSSSDAVKLFSGDDAKSIKQFSTSLKEHIRATSGRGKVYIDLPASYRKRLTLMQHLSRAMSSGKAVDAATKLFEDVGLSATNSFPLAPQLAKVRAVKSQAEIEVMKRAAEISGRAHAKAMRYSQPGMMESQVEAHFEYICKRDGAQRMAYVPVVASGPNGLIIHYTHNTHLIQNEEMILMDAGCEYNGYASDITRTWPANGRFTEPQRELYQAVLNAQKALIGLCRQDANMSMWDLHKKSCELLRTELRLIGFDFGGRPDAIDDLFPHFLTHPIGIDLHESDSFDRHGKLKAGNVITIEPGIYVPPSPEYPSRFHNLCIRIEDEVLVGETQPTVLSASAPKEIVDIEGACQGLLGFEAL